MQKKSTTVLAVYIMIIALMPTLLRSQVVVGTGTPDGSALLEVQGSTGGTLFPRLTTAQRDGITSPATGLILYNTSNKCLEVNVGTATAVEWARLNCLTGVIASLDCAGAAVSGTLQVNQAASGVSVSISFTGGNGGVYDGQTVASTGVTGLSATLSAGSFVSGAGSLTYAITGTSASIGTASFALNIGGQTCTLDVTVTSGQPVCRAKVNATDYKNFMCYNLDSANTSADPFTPTWEINGGYWQWGRSVQAAAGPTGPGSSEANDAAISGWNTTAAVNGSWTNSSKTANDPCPVGYRIPTKAQWDAVIANNTLTNMGTFSNSATNYGAGKKFGNQLMLPAAGYRIYFNGILANHGDTGYYWSTTEYGTEDSWLLYFISSTVSTRQYTNGLGRNRNDGLPVRCIEDTPGSIGTLNCSGSTVTGTISAGQAASGASASVPYTGGDGGPQSGQTVSSTGVTGLTATLSAGSFASDAGNLTYAISGTPASAGTASFALNIGGQTCTLDVTVTSGPPVCRAKVNATDYKNFMCYNLGSANTSADPFTPTWEINGGYWQWGRSVQAAAGPTGPGSSEANDEAISGWNTTAAANGSWLDGSKTANDPCPAGYRIPTKAQWDGVIANNTLTNMGTFSNSATNYGAGKKFGNQLMLPAAGYRLDGDGASFDHGNFGDYWSSTENVNSKAWFLYFGSSNANTGNDYRTYGLSVRCVAE